MAKRKKLGDSDFPDLHANHRGRMRGRILRHGAATLAPHELLEVLLYQPIARQNTNCTAHRLIRHFGSLDRVLHAPPEELERISGVGERSAQFLRDIGRAVDAYAAAKRRGRVVLDNSALARKLASEHFAVSTRANCVLFALDDALRLNVTDTLPDATVQSLLMACAKAQATRAVVALRGDGGDDAPTHTEKESFRRLHTALSLLGVILLDVVVVENGAVRTCRERATLGASVRYDEESRLGEDSLHFGGGRSAVRFADIADERSESGEASSDVEAPSDVEADGFDDKAVAAFAASDAPDDSYSDAEIDPEEIYETVVEPLGTVEQLGESEEDAPPAADTFADLLGDADEQPF